MPWNSKIPDLKNNPAYLEPRVTAAETSLADKTKQANLYAKFFYKLRMGENVLVNCLGDSMTWGLIGGTTNQASMTYPQRLKDCLNLVYPNKVDVVNRGVSGQTAKDAYSYWTTSANSDITLISFGINDYHYGTGGLDDFINYYRKLISRELNWNSAVVILTSPKLKNTDIGVDVYRNAVYALANEYSIPVIDSEMFMANVDASYWSDGWHYNEKGYGYFGAKLASCFIGEGLHKPKVVSDGSTLLTRQTLDNCVYVGNATYYAGSTWTPQEIDGSNGVATQLGIGGAIYYSVYLDSETMSVIPLLSLGANSTIEIEVNFSEQQPQYTFQPLVTEVIDGFPGADERPLNKLTISTVNSKIYHMYSNDLQSLTVSQKGWCTIAVKQTLGSSTFNGLNFINFANRDSKARIIKLEGTKRAEKRIDLSSVSTNFELNMSELINTFNQSSVKTGGFYLEKPYKVSIYVWGNVINEYVFGMGNPAAMSGGEFFATYKSTQIPGYIAANDVKITSMTKDTTNGKLIFNLSAESANVAYGYCAVVSLL